MAKQIEKIHRVLADLEGKNVATKRPPEQIDRVLHMIIVDVFNKHIDHYVKTKKISNYLLPFKRQVDIPLTNGVGPLPEEYAHHRTVALPSGKEIDVVEDKFWDRRVNSKLSPITTTPICRIENSVEGVGQIQVFPTTTTGPIKFSFFKYPAQPIYAYTPNGTRYVYDEDASVDVEFPIGLFPEIVNRLMGAFGIALRDGQLIQISEQLKTQEQAK
jgi:hypothetical protein